MNKLFSLLLCLLVMGCLTNTEDQQSSIELIPNTAQVIIASPSSKQLNKDLELHHAILAASPLNNSLKETKQLLKFLRSKDAITLYIVGNSTGLAQPVIITTRDTAAFALDSITNKQVETINKDNIALKKFKLETVQFYQRDLDQFSLYAKSINALMDSEDPDSSLDSHVQKAIHAADVGKTSLIFSSNIKFPFFTDILNGGAIHERKREENSWSVVDMDGNKSKLTYNGVTMHPASGRSSQAPKFTPEIARICPQDFESFVTMSPSLRFGNLDSLSQQNVVQKVREVSKVRLKDGNLHVWNTLETELSKNQLFSGHKLSERFREIDIFSGNTSSPFLTAHGKGHVQFYFSSIEDFLVVSEKSALLKEIIINFQNGRTLSQDSQYEDLMNSLSSEASIINVSRISGSKEKTSGEGVNLTTGSLAAFQLVGESGFDHLHGVIVEPAPSSKLSKGAEQLLSIATKNAVTGAPQFFKNHETDQMDIAVQDQENKLSLYSNKGSIYWTKQLESKIMGRLWTVDLFKNGNNQLAFSTGFNLEVLDRKGRDVGPFPKKFKDPLTQALAVFDYDKNRNYRFVLTQKDRIYMLDPKGNSVNGFNFEKTKNSISKAPKHIRLGNKDYILVQEDSGRLQILSRQGKIRVPTPSLFDVSENEWYGYNSQFITTQPKDQLIVIDQNGKKNLKNLGLAENNRLVANSHNLVYLNENTLVINDVEVTLDFGLYTQPQLFTIARTSFIGITDVQAKKVYVFNEKGSLLPGFPVFGTSEIDLANADLDKRMEMIVRGSDKEVLLYKL